MIPGVVEQRHESEVHVQLLVTVEQRQAGIVRGKRDVEFLISAQHDDIFHKPGGGQSCRRRYLETVSLKVNGKRDWYSDDARKFQPVDEIMMPVSIQLLALNAPLLYSFYSIECGQGRPCP